jgi:glycosyltransferase involved in cell wall biosynthesis
MGHGLPCVATPVGDIADAVGNDAFLVEPENPQALARILNHLMSDSLTRDALGSRARARAMRDFSVRRMVNETEEVIFCATGNLKGHET